MTESNDRAKAPRKRARFDAARDGTEEPMRDVGSRLRTAADRANRVARGLRTVTAPTRGGADTCGGRGGTTARTPKVDLAAEAQSLVADLEELKADVLPALADASRSARLVEGLEAISTSPGEKEVLDQALDAIVAILGARRGFIVLCRNGQTEIVTARNQYAVHLSEAECAWSRSILEESLRRGEPILITDVRKDPGFGTLPSVRQLGLVGVLAVPFRIGQMVVGALWADTLDPAAGPFRPALLPRIGRFVQAIACALERLREIERLGGENQALHERLGRRAGFHAVLTASPAMSEALAHAHRFAQMPWPVLLVGESGTGKELLARGIHAASPRRDQEFLTLNMSAIPETLAEDTLFGHEKGAFAGADALRRGSFEAATGGTLFLDEIGDAPIAVQTKLLRAIQFGEIQRLGSDRPLPVDVRVIAATHQDLQAAAREGRFRSDLLFRLNPLTVRIPPLRERREDIALLTRHFVAQHEAAAGKRGVRMEAAVLARLEAFEYRNSNVRELENAVKRMLALAEGDLLGVGHLPPELLSPVETLGGPGRADASSDAMPSATRTPPSGPPAGFPELDEAKRVMRDEMDRAFIERVIAQAKGDVKKAAHQTGTDRSWFYTRARELGISFVTLRRRAGPTGGTPVVTNPP